MKPGSSDFCHCCGGRSSFRSWRFLSPYRSLVRGHLHVGVCDTDRAERGQARSGDSRGIPTIVYGFFALVTFGPLLRDLGGTIGLEIAASSVSHGRDRDGDHVIPMYRRYRTTLSTLCRNRCAKALWVSARPNQKRSRKSSYRPRSRGLSVRSARSLARDRRDHDRGAGRRYRRQPHAEPT